MKDGTWIPPIKRYEAKNADDHVEPEDYDFLLEHHEKETKILLAVIQELSTRLLDTTK